MTQDVEILIEEEEQTEQQETADKETEIAKLRYLSQGMQQQLQKLR